jgi:hypothetical protein
MKFFMLMDITGVFKIKKPQIVALKKLKKLSK